MYSTPKSGVLFIACAALLIGGCNSVPMQQVQDRVESVRRAYLRGERPSQEIIDSVMIDPPADQAAQVRGWESTTFLYPNGATLAYPTYGMNYEDRPRWLSNDYLVSLATPAILLYDIFAMPLNIIIEPPGTAVVYHGARQPASMTLEPPLQTEAQARQWVREQEREKLQQQPEQQEPAPQPPPDAQPPAPPSDQPAPPAPPPTPPPGE